MEAFKVAWLRDGLLFGFYQSDFLYENMPAATPVIGQSGYHFFLTAEDAEDFYQNHKAISWVKGEQTKANAVVIKFIAGGVIEHSKNYYLINPRNVWASETMSNIEVIKQLS